MGPRIGFDRRVRMKWLDALVGYLVQHPSEEEARAYLHDLLSRDHPGHKARSNTVTVLMRMWVSVAPEHEGQKDQAWALLAETTEQDRLCLHWGMAVMAFPLFRAAAATIGRLLSMQEDVSLAQVQRRLVESFGQRSTLARASQRVVSSMTDWGALVRTGSKGRFRKSESVPCVRPDVQLWLLEALLCTDGRREMDARELLAAPDLFPFRLTVGVSDLRRCPRFQLYRQGLDMEVVALASE